MSSDASNPSRTVQTSCQAVLQMIRWAETKGITPEEQETRHLRTKVFIQGQLEIIRGAVTDGVVVPRWMVALESAFRTLGNESHPNYKALSHGQIPIPSDHPWLRFTVKTPPAPPMQSMPPAPILATLSQNPSNVTHRPSQRPMPVIDNSPPANTPSAAAVQPTALMPHPKANELRSQPSHPVPRTVTDDPPPAASQTGTWPAPKVRRKAAVEPTADDGSGTTSEAVNKTDKRKGKAKEIQELAERRQERPKRRQADPEPMEIDEDGEDDDDIQVIEPEQVRGRTKGRRSGKRHSPNYSRPAKSKARPSASDPEVDQTPTLASPHSNKVDCLNCVKYNRKCDKQEGMACKPCQQNKQKCEHSAKNKRRGVASGSGAADSPAQSSSARRTSVKRPSSASESWDSDDNEESTIQDESAHHRKKTKVGEESENPLDDPRQTIIVPGPRGMTFAGVVPPAIPRGYPRVVVPASRPPTARPTRNPSGGRTGPAAVRPDPHTNCVSKEDFDALVERIRTLEQAVDTLGSVIGSGWAQVGASSIFIRSTTLKYPFELQRGTSNSQRISNPTPHATAGTPPSLPSMPLPEAESAPRPSTPENQECTMLGSSPTPRATSVHEGRSRHGTLMARPASPTTERQSAEASGSTLSRKGGPLVDFDEDAMVGMEASG